MQNSAISSRSFARNLILIGGLLLYACAFALLLSNKSFDIAGAVIVLVVFGIVLPLIAWIASSPCYSALNFHSAGRVGTDRLNRIRYRVISLLDRRAAVD